MSKSKSMELNNTTSCMCHFPETRGSTINLIKYKLLELGVDPSSVSISTLADEDPSVLMAKYGMSNICTEDRDRRFSKSDIRNLEPSKEEYYDNRSFEERIRHIRECEENVMTGCYYVENPNYNF